MSNIFLAIILATAGQVLLSRHDLRGLIPYALAVVILVYALWQDQHGDEGKAHSPSVASAPAAPRGRRRLIQVSLVPIALACAVVAFVSASDNAYRWYGAVAWVLAVGLFLIILWENDSGRIRGRKSDWRRDGWRLRWTTVVVIGLLLLGFWFRFWQLDELPTEMTSDHVEKLLDVHDLVTGQRPIFLVRNTGREPWQFYWTLMFIRLLDLDTKFFALKLGTAVVGLITLPGVYLLGRDLFGRWVGLLALLFSAVASWSVTLSRIGLRFPFAPAVTAWSLFFLLRGLRDGRRNDFLLLGVCLGIGMQGYTAFRAMPVAVIVCWGLAFALQPSSLAVRRSSLLRNALLTVLIALVVFIPLGRFSLEHPEDFWQRSFSRIADPNQSMPDSPPITFVKNLADLALMFHWQGDDVWVNTLTDTPVLDPVLGGLLTLGLVIVFWRGLRLRDPIPPFLLIAGLILLLPSALSLAYPMENPSVVRTGGAIPAVMVIAALPVSLAIERGSRDWRTRWHLTNTRQATVWNLRAALLVLGVLALAITVTAINYRRYFVDYWNQYRHNAINTTEIASAIRGFVESGGDAANAWIIAWPYWVDTRGVGIELGSPPWNNVILSPEELDAHGDPPLGEAGPDTYAGRPRFYVLYRNDVQSLTQLYALFPDGWSSLYSAEQPERSFVLFYVPRTSPQGLMQNRKGMGLRAP
jgi:MFS family permease